MARGGSKELPRKNVKVIAGKPLIAHSIQQAKEIDAIDDIFVSTDDDEIKKISLEFGAKVVDRPKNLATDNSLYLDAVKHMIKKIPNIQKNSIIILLQPTSPLRNPIDIKNCLDLFQGNVDCIVSVSNVKKHPSRMFIEKNGFLEFFLNREPLSNRQDEEKLFEMNGSILVSNSNFLQSQKNIVLGGKMKGYLLDDVHSIDIDTIFDFEICKYFMEK